MINSDNIRDWDARLKEQADRGWDNYLRRRIHLDVARNNDIWDICGEFLTIEEASSPLAVGSIRLNRDRNDAIDLERGTVIKTMFTRIFITHAALQDEWIDIVYGINFEYYKQHHFRIQEPLSVDDNGGSITVDGEVTTIDNGVAQECIIITHANADTNQAGANNPCKRVLIRAHTINTGLVWVNFGAAAVDGSDYPLDAGDAMSVPVTNTNQVNCLFKVGGEKVTVVFTN